MKICDICYEGHPVGIMQDIDGDWWAVCDECAQIIDPFGHLIDEGKFRKGVNYG